ncbi:MAG: CDP-glycerol glycerophosphotransferase family protein [Bauldia sp.]|nr:CDP-glycerol glycerophosphotransferase family protein [Bauldia sp.]
MTDTADRLGEEFAASPDLARGLADFEARHRLPKDVPRVLYLGRGQPGTRWFRDPRTGAWTLMDIYAENVPEALASWCRAHGWRLTVFTEGAPHAYEGDRLSYEARYPGVAEEILASEVNPFFPSRGTVSAAFEDHYRQLVLDPGFRDAFSYDGVPLFETLRDQVPLLARLAAGYVFGRGRWMEVLRALKPAIVVGGRLDTRGDLNSAAHALGVMTVGVKLGISEEMLTPFAIADADGRFLSDAFPDALAVWGESQRDLIRRRFPDCTAELIVSGRTRNDTFVAVAGAEEAGARLRDFLGIAAQTRIIVYGANHQTKYGQGATAEFGAVCMSPESYRRGLEELDRLAAGRGDAVVVVKPHPADDVAFIRSAVESAGSPRLRLLVDDDGFHNAELLAQSDVFVSSVSSMFAEAVLADCPAINLWTPDVNYLYESHRRDIYGTIATTVEDWDALAAETTRLLDDPAYRRSQLAQTRAALEPIFGGFDGRNAERLVAGVFALYESRSRGG